MKKKITIKTIIVYIILIAVAASTIYPIVFMILSSFKSKYEYMLNIFGIPQEWTLSNFKAIFKSYDVGRLMFNSFFVTITAVVIGLIITSMAAYSLSKIKYRGRGVIFRIFMFVLLVPSQALMMPVYIIVSKMGLVNTYTGIILIYISTSVAFSTYLLVQNCKDIPDEMIDAAKIDGAGYVKVYHAVVLPMLKPTIATLAILNFLSYWNEIVYTRLILQKTEYHTMTLGLMTISGKYGTNMPLLMSGLIINMIPAFLIFAVFNKYLSKGIAMGSVK